MILVRTGSEALVGPALGSVTGIGRSSGASGFSLVEILCAVLILGIALVGLTQGITTALRSNKESELQTTASLYAAGVIEALRAEGGLETGMEEGECGPGLPLYRWKRTVTTAKLDGLYDVDVEVLQAKTGKTIYALQTSIFELPTTSGSNRNGREKSQTRGGTR